MLRVVFSLVVALAVGLGTAAAKDPAKPKKSPTVKPKPTAEETFRKLDKDRDGKLTKEELIGDSKSPDAAERAERIIKAKDKDGDGMLSLTEYTGRTEPKEKPKVAKPPKPSKRVSRR